MTRSLSVDLPSGISGWGRKLLGSSEPFAWFHSWLPVLVPIVGFWRAGSRPKAHHLGKAGRVGVYILLAPMVLACVYGQWSFAKAILIQGGALPG
jgi:hypothetical protein